MTATTSELLDSYTKMLDSEFYKNLKGITADASMANCIKRSRKFY